MSSSGAIMENSHYGEEIWSEAVADTLDGFVSIEETAQRLGMSHDAAFHMRHKILMSIEAREKASPSQLGGISELDETYVLERLKGRNSLKTRSGNRESTAKKRFREEFQTNKSVL